MGKRTKLPPADPLLVAELRQIDEAWRAGAEERNAAFRDEWAARVAGKQPARSPLIPRSEFRPTR